MTAILQDPSYEQRIYKAAAFNKRMAHERIMRLPFLDSQTGVAQSHTNLVMPRHYRLPGKCYGQFYSYPAKRWKKKKSNLSYEPVRPVPELDTSVTSEMHQIVAVENPAVKETYERAAKEQHLDKSLDMSRFYGDEWETLSETPDAGEIDRRHSDSSDFEDSYVKKRKKKTTKGKSKGGGASTRKSTASKSKGSNASSAAVAQAAAAAMGAANESFTETHAPYDEVLDKPYSCDRSSHERPASTAPSAAEPPEPAGKYCDFCLGNELENKKTGMPEELVSCADCGRSGHPSCLQFTVNMMVSVKKYPWQCIECKSCGLCGTSENDDQLLFCDDCDRGFHMYCLKPPLTEPPDGNWSCHLCIQEFYGGKKPDNIQ